MTLLFKKDQKSGVGNSQPVSLTLIPEKNMKWIHLGNVSEHMREKKVTRAVSMV